MTLIIITFYIKDEDDEEMEDITVSVSVEHEYSVKIVNPCRMFDFKTVIELKSWKYRQRALHL